ncbi:MAG: Zn-dependent alcohol dehydrogenase [Actinobacteria bacterium]|nr:Zn-dependent alcohol dehydrogenase [Actinomycetota bacterium]
MQAALLTEPGKPLEIVDDVELESPRAGEVEVELEYCGLCHSDLHFIDGSLPGVMPMLLGHEAGGIVTKVGLGVLDLVEGDKVILSLRPSCGRCYFCVRGDFTLCEQSAAGLFPDGGTRLTRGGEPVQRMGVNLAAFATHTVVPAAAAVKVPDDTPLDIASVLGCSVQTGFGAVVSTAHVQPGATVMVIGLGGVGISIVQSARIVGASRIIGVDMNKGRREQSLQFGCTDTIDPAEGDVAQQVLELLGGRGVDQAFEAVGSSALTEVCIASTRNGGTTTMVGIPKLSDSVSIHAIVFATGGKKLLGCFMGHSNPHREFPRLISLWRNGKLDLEAMVTSKRPLSEINDAVADMQAGLGLRTVLSV